MAALSTEVQKMLNDLGFDGNTRQSTRKSDLTYFQQTHLGQDGKNLSVTGKADDATLWALKHPGGKSQKSGIAGKIPNGITGKRKELLLLALGEHKDKVRERPNGSNRSRRIDKYLPGWVLRKLGMLGKGPAWCAFFVNWLFTETMGSRPWGGYIGSCVRLVKAAQKSDKCRVFIDAARVGPGDIFVIVHGSTGHTGVVLRKNADSTKINTVEGNCGNRVKLGLRDTKDIAYFISVLPPPDKLSSPLLKVAATGKAKTR